jgi:hypothetical protein
MYTDTEQRFIKHQYATRIQNKYLEINNIKKKDLAAYHHHD